MLEVKPFENLIVATHITGVYDVNRNTVLKDDDFTIVKVWADSISALKLNGIIFHNNFSEATVKAYTTEFIQFVRVDYNPQFNPNVFRYFIYDALLDQYAAALKHIFFTDSSDVVVAMNPFTQALFLDNPDAIFCGDEPELLENPWMQAHSSHLRNGIADYADYEKLYKNETLLNCGVFGGQIHMMRPFIKKLWAIHQTYNHDNATAYTGDMGAFNYLIRTQYNEQVIHGAPVNSEFKSYDASSNFWFKHK